MKGDIIMTLYELTHDATVQGNIILEGFYNDGHASDTVFMERDVDDLDYCLPGAIEDCDVTYIYCDKNGWMHIDFDAPEYLRVKEMYADNWTNESIPEDGLIVGFDELVRLSHEWGKDVCDLLEECEVM